MLFVYLAAKSDIKSIFGQLAFCKEFSTPFIKDTRMGYCLTTMEIALKLLAEEQDLIKIEPDEVESVSDVPLWVAKRTSFKQISSRKSIDIRKGSFNLVMDGNILEEVVNNTFKKQRMTIVGNKNMKPNSMRQSMVIPSSRML